MRTRVSRYIIYTIALVCTCMYAAADTLSRSIPSADWQRLINDKAFRYRSQTEYVAHKHSQHSDWLGHLLDSIFRVLAAVFQPWVLWTIFIAVIAYIAYRVIKDTDLFSFKRNRKANNVLDGDTEELIMTNWDLQLQDALAAGDVRMAIRYSYMLLLQLLQERALIQYRQDKTNYEYYRELADTAYGNYFKNLSRQYEYAWYGNLPLQASTFDAYMQNFSLVRDKLKAS